MLTCVWSVLFLITSKETTSSASAPAMGTPTTCRWVLVVVCYCVVAVVVIVVVIVVIVVVVVVIVVVSSSDVHVTPTDQQSGRSRGLDYCIAFRWVWFTGIYHNHYWIFGKACSRKCICTAGRGSYLLNYIHDAHDAGPHSSHCSRLHGHKYCFSRTYSETLAW